METVEIKNHELNEEELEKAAGGSGYGGLRCRIVCNLEAGYLAIRSQPAFVEKNELGCLYNGYYVYSTNRYCGEYVWVYADVGYDPTYHKGPYAGYGWVNSRFLSK